MDKIAFNSKAVEDWHVRLNSKENAPERGYRRNVVVYELVCYVNNIVGCYLSKNDEPIPVFIGRARKFMQDHPSNDGWHEYYEMVGSYLDAVESDLSENGFNVRSIYTD
jgi:hypothetical protein